MEQQRTLIFLALCFVMYLMYDAWQKDFVKPKQPVTQSQTPEQKQTNTDKPAPTAVKQEMPLPGKENIGTTVTAPATPAETKTTAKSAGEKILVKTDVYNLWIDTAGGDIQQLELVDYPVSIAQKEIPFRLLDETDRRFFSVQSGWYPYDGTVPDKNTVFNVSRKEFIMQQADKSLVVDLSWKNKQGVEFIKRYRFDRDDKTPSKDSSYIINVEHIVNNPTKAGFDTSVYLRMVRSSPLESSGFFMLPTYIGPVYYAPDVKYHKVSFSDIDKVDPTSGVKNYIKRKVEGGWAGVIEQFFVAAWLPQEKDNYEYFTNKLENNHYMVGMSKPLTVAADSSQQISSSRLYVGPKLQKSLETVAPGLELSVDYGWLTFISKPLFWLLNQIDRFVGNWGWSIILLTILIKLVFYKLSETSYRSMATLKRAAPMMQALKERYADDKQKMQQAMMDLYRKEKINPLGGCLPILIQIPVFIALYYVLIESVELRQAPWILWIEDLSIMDPYFVLPIIMGITMYIQQKLNPQPVDPMQAKIMMMLPLIFTVMFAVFPSGLVLYWVVNNVLSIAQQAYITKVVLKEKK